MIKINLTNEIYSKQKIQYARPVDKTIVESEEYAIKTSHKNSKMRGLELKKIIPIIETNKYLSFSKFKEIWSEYFTAQFFLISRITQILKPKGE